VARRGEEETGAMEEAEEKCTRRGGERRMVKLFRTVMT
jgi:hypothetical protein